MVVAMQLNALGTQMLPDLIATVILAGMMLVPIINVIVAVVIGSVLGGVPGARGGVGLAVAIMAVERWLFGLAPAPKAGDIQQSTRAPVPAKKRAIIRAPHGPCSISARCGGQAPLLHAGASCVGRILSATSASSPPILRKHDHSGIQCGITKAI